MHLPALISALDGEKGHKSLIVSSNLCLSFGLKKKKKKVPPSCVSRTSFMPNLSSLYQGFRVQVHFLLTLDMLMVSTGI
jgi:hypothetical protein